MRWTRGSPPNDLTFSVGESANLLIEKLHGEVQKVNVQLPMPKSQKHPVTAPQAVTTERLSDEIGLLRVAMFPGAIGIDVAKDIDRGIAALDGCSRLIVDLRGNTGGGIGGLRLMSYLTPGKLEVGYSLTRKRRERGYRREELTRFGRIPSHKATLIWLAARYAFVEKSILVVTEGLGQRRFHGRVVLLVNEHTASAGEMVSAFAEENNLATIVGTKTPGRLLSGSAYKVGHGYILGLPVAAYLTWQGRMLENNGIVPKFSIELSRDALKEGRDTQLETAIEVAKGPITTLDDKFSEMLCNARRSCEERVFGRSSDSQRHSRKRNRKVLISMFAQQDFHCPSRLFLKLAWPASDFDQWQSFPRRWFQNHIWKQKLRCGSNGHSFIVLRLGPNQGRGLRIGNNPPFLFFRKRTVLHGACPVRHLQNEDQR